MTPQDERRWSIVVHIIWLVSVAVMGGCELRFFACCLYALIKGTP